MRGLCFRNLPDYPAFVVGISNGKVTFLWKDYAHGSKRRLMTLTAEEFLRRFLLHTLPRAFVRVRSFGFLANRQRTAVPGATRPNCSLQCRSHKERHRYKVATAG